MVASPFLAVNSRSASKFGRPDDKCFVEHASRLQVPQKSGNRLIDSLRVNRVFGHVAMLVPVVAATAIDEFDEADTTFREAPGDQALPAEAFAFVSLQPVEVKSGIVFLVEIKGIVRFRLHVIGGLERADAGVQTGVAAAGLQVPIVQHVGQSQFKFLEAAGFRSTVEIGDRFLAADDAHALVVSREEVVVENLCAGIRHLWCEGNE